MWVFSFRYSIWLVFVAALVSLSQMVSAKVTARFSKKWQTVGPFIRGNFEHDGDPLEFYGGIKNLIPGKSGPFLSEMANGNYVDWIPVDMDSKGHVRFPYPTTDFKFITHTLKSEAASNSQSWAVGKLKVSHDGVYVVYCPHLHTLEIGSRLLRGSIHLESGFPVNLSAGTHPVYVKVSGQNHNQFGCSITPTKAEVGMLSSDHTPHLHEGDFFATPWLAPKVLNMGLDWLRSDELQFKIEDHRTHSSIKANVEIDSDQPNLPTVLAPGVLLQMPLKLRMSWSVNKGSKFPDAECVHFSLKLYRRSTGGLLASDRVNLKCRQKHQSFLFTYLDDDGSVSVSAAIRPRCGSNCARPPFPIALTLSGVSVGPLNQADSYKIGDGKGGFLFGFKEGWTLAPERGGPHNWEDWGFRTAMSAVNALALATKDTEMSVDVNRLYIAGHSRGGHGAWNIGLRIPDRALAISPAGGWTYRQYGGVSWNEDFIHDMQNSYLDPTLLAILRRCMIEGHSELVASNIKGIDVLVRQGTADQTVAPFLNRRMARTAAEAGARVEVSEIGRTHNGQQAGHWWWDTKESNDGGVVNDATMRAFATKHLKGKHPALPEHFRVTVINPSSFSGRGGIRVLQTEVPLRKAYIDVYQRTGGIWEIHTINVRRFAFSPTVTVTGLSIDNSVFDATPSFGSHLCRVDVTPRRWLVCPNVADYEKTERGPSTWAPARQVTLSRFAIVAHTEIDLAYAQAVQDAALYISHGHLMAVHSHAQVLRPDDITTNIRLTHNLIHLGSPSALQMVPATVRSRWPVNVESSAVADRAAPPDRCLASARPGACAQMEKSEASFAVGPCEFHGARHGLVFTAPRWEEDAPVGGQAFLDLIVTGTDINGFIDIVTYHHATLARSPFGNMAPDYLVSGPQYKAKGFAGLVAAGFWGAQWEWRADSAYMEC